MWTIDRQLRALQRRVRAEPLLYRLTLGTRVLLAVGFIPTGLVKLLGYRFAYISTATPLGDFFETLYLSGPYWQFLGLVQLLAGVLVLWPATAALGAVVFFGIMLNIFVITLSYDFNYTPVVTSAMLLACGYLLLWDYHRLRTLVDVDGELRTEPESFPTHTLNGNVERGAYVAGVITGLGFFTGLRGLFFPPAMIQLFLVGCLLSFGVALWCGLVRRAPTVYIEDPRDGAAAR